MLVLTRKPTERIFIGEDIEITVVSVHREKVRLGIVAPKSTTILRDNAKHIKEDDEEAETLCGN